VASLVKQKGLTGKVMVFGVDGLPVMFKAIKAGDAVATMKQDNVRMGTEIVDDAITIVNGGQVGAKVLIPGILIDKNNVDQYLGGAAAQPAKNPADITIAYSGYATSNDFWNTLGKAAAAEAKAKGVKFVDLTTETQDAAAQKANIDTVITQKPSAIIIGSVDPNVFKDTIAKAKAAGIPILAVDTAIDDPYISALVQTDNLATAQVLGDYICKLLNGAQGTALVMAGSVAHQTGDARQKGVAEKLAACGMKVIKEYSDWDENKAVQISTDTITANPDLKLIFAPWDPGAAAVASLVKQKGLTGKVMVFGVDGLPVMFKAIKAGDAVATMKQDNVRMGTEIVDDAITIVNGGQVDAKVLIPGILIDKNNVDQYLK
jgi:ribose transport system substrate-binding protein